MRNIKIIYEDNEIMVIEKPSGLVTDTVGNYRGETLQDWLKVEILRSGIVHRLDKETSGLLVVAKTSQALENLQEQFRDRKVKKEYTALAHGLIAEGNNAASFIVNAPIGRNPKNTKKFAVVEGGREAITKFKVGLRYPLGNARGYTLLYCYPKTGRTHQIRVHLTALNHPIVLDPLYVGRKRYKMDAIWCPRMFLHATKLEFRHPVTGEWVKFRSDLPKELKNSLKFLITN